MGLRWTGHPEARTTLEGVRLIHRLQPRCGIWENVLGFDQGEGEHGKTGKQLVIDELSKLGYATQAVQGCPSLMMSFVHRRTGIGRQL